MYASLLILCVGAAVASAGGFYEPADHPGASKYYKVPAANQEVAPVQPETHLYTHKTIQALAYKPPVYKPRPVQAFYEPESPPEKPDNFYTSNKPVGLPSAPKLIPVYADKESVLSSPIVPQPKLIPVYGPKESVLSSPIVPQSKPVQSHTYELEHSYQPFVYKAETSGKKPSYQRATSYVNVEHKVSHQAYRAANTLGNIKSQY